MSIVILGIPNDEDELLEESSVQSAKTHTQSTYNIELTISALGLCGWEGFLRVV